MKTKIFTNSEKEVGNFLKTGTILLQLVKTKIECMESPCRTA